MRIAVVYDCLFPWTTGGGERLYRVFAETFAELGHEVTYLTRRQWTGPTPDVPGFEVVAVSPASGLYDSRGGRRLGPALRFTLDLLRHLARHRSRYDAVLVSALPLLNVFAVRAALVGRRTPVCADWLEVWTPQQWRQYSGPVTGRIAALLQRVAVRLSPLSSCHSRLTAGRLLAQGLRERPLVSPGLIHGQVTSRPDTEPVDPPVAVFVGRHIEDKRVESLPAALDWARQRVPTLRGLILGDGPRRVAVLREVRRLGLQDVIAVPGFVPQDEMEQAVRRASVLVNPSAREGYGIVVIEAAAAGTPVVLADGPDNASVELVEPGVNGFVARTTTPEDLGRCIVQAVQGGEPLRRTSLAWFRAASGTKTMVASAGAVAAALERAAGSR